MNLDEMITFTKAMQEWVPKFVYTITVDNIATVKYALSGQPQIEEQIALDYPTAPLTGIDVFVDPEMPHNTMRLYEDDKLVGEWTIPEWRIV